MENTQAIVTLSALAQETRLDIFRLLVEAGLRGMPAGRIGEELDVPSPTLSFHLKELRHAGIVKSSKKGRSITYRADFAAMSDLVGYLLENCCGRSDETQTDRSENCCTECGAPQNQEPDSGDQK